MQSLFFWKTWVKDYRWAWYLSAGVFALTVIFLWFSYLQGAGGVIKWVKLQEQKVIESTVHSFNLGPFELSVPGDNYVILEYFHGSDISPNVAASYFFLFALLFGAMVMLAVITTLERFWFFTGMGLFIAFVASLRLEVLGVFGLSNQIPVIISLLLFVIPSYYFNRIEPTVSFVIRLSVFFIITAMLAITISLFSSVHFPFYHLTLTGYTPALIISVLFIIMIAHEILASLVYVVSQGSSKSLRHISIISVIYLSNIFITCFHELGVIQWNFLYVNLYLLLTISAILGIWGFRQREILYANIFSFAPFGAFFFIAMGAICFATSGNLLANANDPALKVIRDAIIFSHTGYGLIFLIYLFSNFVLLLARNLPVYKVLYNPTRMPYFTYRFAGMITMLAFVFYSGWREYVFNGLAGFYNTAGDLYSLSGNDTYAESFYEQGQSHGFQNNRSNYALATLRSARFNLDDAHYDYRLANAKRPTAFSLANAGNIYMWESETTDAIRMYQQGNTRLGGSSILENNLGFAYTKVHNLDSAVFYLSKAREDAFTKASAETNFFALAALELIPLKIDSTLKIFDQSYNGVTGNAMALSTLQRQDFNTEVSPLKEKKLNLYSATLLNNYIIKYAATIDTTFIQQAFAIASDSINSDYSETIKSALAFGFYLQGNVSRALNLLAELTFVTQSSKGKFNYIMGLWALEQKNPELASVYFTYADTYDYKDARFYNAIALSESGKISEALVAWDTLFNGGDVGQKAIALQIKNVLSLQLADVVSLSDHGKYQFCRYKIGLGDSLSFNRIVNTFESADYKAQAILDFSHKYYDAGELITAIRYFNRIAGLELTDKRLYEDVRHFELLMLSERGDMITLAQQINKGIVFDQKRGLEKLLFTAVIAESSGDTTTAKKNYEILGEYNPYFEEGIISAAAFFRKRGKNKLKPYTILSEAIQINANSIRLLRAYAAEATRIGFDDYALSAMERVKALEKNLR